MGSMTSNNQLLSRDIILFLAELYFIPVIFLMKIRYTVYSLRMAQPVFICNAKPQTRETKFLKDGSESHQTMCLDKHHAYNS